MLTEGRTVHLLFCLHLLQQEGMFPLRKLWRAEWKGRTEAWEGWKHSQALSVYFALNPQSQTASQSTEGICPGSGQSIIFDRSWRTGEGPCGWKRAYYAFLKEEEKGYIKVTLTLIHEESLEQIIKWWICEHFENSVVITDFSCQSNLIFIG